MFFPLYGVFPATVWGIPDAQQRPRYRTIHLTFTTNTQQRQQFSLLTLLQRKHFVFEDPKLIVQQRQHNQHNQPTAPGAEHLYVKKQPRIVHFYVVHFI